MSILSFFVATAVVLLLVNTSHTQDTPWIIRPTDCTGYAHCVVIDFSKVPRDVVVLGTSSGFTKTFLVEPSDGGEDGTYSCAKPDEGTTRCLFSPSNVRVANGALELLVPGGVKPNETIGTSQVTFTDATIPNTQFIMSGYFEVEAQTSNIPGTCHGIFTQANPGYPMQKDEQDIEILTGHYMNSSADIPAGLEFTSWAAFPANDSMSGRMINSVVAYGFDPTSNFYKYSIEWDKTMTIYGWGVNSIKRNIYSSQNPSKLVINNWSNASKGWTEGPPKTDNILRVRRIKAYYNTKP